MPGLSPRQEGIWETAHHLTSRQPTRDSIAGKFGEGQNIFRAAEPELHYRMEAKSDGFYQTAVLGTPPAMASISKRFDIVLGSGRKGQSYLYWSGDQLFELPISYWTELGKWVNSPGYEDGSLDFSRPVTPRCLERHASFFESIPDSGVVNRYNKSTESRWPEGDWRNSYFVPENLNASVERAELLRPLVLPGMTMPELALRFILNNPTISTTIPGMRKLGHVESNVAACDAGPLPHDLYLQLRPHRWDRQPTAWSQ